MVSYPADSDLRAFLKASLDDGIVPLPIFVSTFLRWASQSPDLRDPTTLDLLCRLALDTHYANPSTTPIGSIVATSDPPVIVLGSIHDSLTLLRSALSSPISRFHQLSTSAAGLVVLLLSCLRDMSQITNGQVMLTFAVATDIMPNIRLQPEVRQVIENFVISSSLVIGDETKAARDVMLQYGKADPFNSSPDIVTFGLTFHYLVRWRHMTQYLVF